jgi:hypothetical protein
MTFEHKPNRGSLFRNEEKKTGKHPDSQGSALIGGTEYYISAWRNAEPGKKVYWSLSFQEKGEKTQGGGPAKAIPLEDDFDTIPFIYNGGIR